MVSWGFQGKRRWLIRLILEAKFGDDALAKIGNMAKVVNADTKPK